MAFAASLSEHPLPTHATGEVLGQVLEDLRGEPPDLAVLFVTGPHAGALEDIAATVRSVLSPGTLLAATAVSVLGGREEAEEVPAVALWAGHTGAVDPVSFDVVRGPDGPVVVGVEPEALDEAGTLLLLADPASFPVDPFLATLRERHPALQVVGGLASAGFGPGVNRLVVDGIVVDHGAVGALIPPGRSVTAVVSQGCAPVGSPFTVTRAERNMLLEIAGRPALERVQELIEGMTPDQRSKAAHGLHVGRVIDEHKDRFERGDFLIRNVMGADRSNGAVAVGDEIEIGDTIQFQVRDADSADEDLRLLLDEHEAAAALVFTCNGRGKHLFGVPHHDASVVAETLDTTAIAGMFCAGEIGPVGGRSFLHGFTASIVLFR
jgi:small ligand-binding sensory domain FIST